MNGYQQSLRLVTYHHSLGDLITPLMHQRKPLVLKKQVYFLIDEFLVELLIILVIMIDADFGCYLWCQKENQQYFSVIYGVPFLLKRC